MIAGLVCVISLEIICGEMEEPHLSIKGSAFVNNPFYCVMLNRIFFLADGLITLLRLTNSINSFTEAPSLWHDVGTDLSAPKQQTTKNSAFIEGATLLDDYLM